MGLEKEEQRSVLPELISLYRAWRIFLREKGRKIVIVICFSTVCGLLLSFLIQPKYIATTSFILETTSKSSVGDYASIASKLGLSLQSGGGIFQKDENIISFIKSRTMIANALYSIAPTEGEQKLLIEWYLKESGLTDGWKNDKRLSSLSFHIDETTRTVLEDSVVTLAYKTIVEDHLLIDKPDHDADVIVVSTTFKDEIFSKMFNQALLENVVDFYIDLQTRKLSYNVNILQRQVDSVKSLLNVALSGAAEMSEANPNPNPAFQRLKVPTQRKSVDVEMNKAILEELVKHLELAKISLRKETPLFQVIDKPVLPLEKKKLGKLKGIVLGFVVGGLLSLFYFSLAFYFKRVF
ncbi:MAG TPA: hypothetical protein PL009_08605 [Flavipsychrobacter sp.]|nr:hypothetical protein [Flavipsychrobacter sp.]